MPYTAIQSKGGATRTQARSLTPTSGLDLRDLPQLLQPELAFKMVNYITDAQGRLKKRKGIEELFTVGGTDPITFIERYDSDLFIFGYGTTVAAYSVSADAVTSIKADFTDSDALIGVRYGDYFFASNGIEKIFRISRTLDYDAQTGNFTAGDIVTGGTSGATAIILEDNDSGVTGTLTLGNISGTFSDGEVITDPSGGSADVDGTVDWTASEVTDSSPCTVMKVINARLFTNSDTQGEVKYCAIDDGTNPPFTDWTTSATADDAGGVNDRFIGNINAIEALGENIVVFGDKGKFAFFINTIDSAGTLTKVEVFQMSRRDFGGASGAIATDIGLVYMNEAGLWALSSIGQPNIPFSDQEGLITKLLGPDYFADATFTNTDIVYDERQNLVLLTYGDDSTTNNAVIAYNVETKAMSEFSGWTFNRWLNDDGTIYAGSAVDGAVYTCFVGYDDDGLSIGTEFEQEMQLGSLEELKDIGKFYVQGFLTSGAPITVSFNVYDRTGRYASNRMQYTWSAQVALGSGKGYDAMAYDAGAYDGDLDSSELIESFDGAMTGIKRVLRLRVNFSASDTSQHEINWFSVAAKRGPLARRRKLTKV